MEILPIEQVAKGWQGGVGKILRDAQSKNGAG
jgi:hypothetical protein